MFKTTPRQIVDILAGPEIDLNEALEFTRFQAEDVHPIKIGEKEVQYGIDGISFRNINPQCIPYLAPTISPGPVSARPDYLEHPQEIFDEYREKGQTRIIGELKHMGSNATIIVYRDEASALKYSGQTQTTYIISRSGFKFFTDPKVEEAVVTCLRDSLNLADYFNLFGIDFAIWNAEILPWNAKASGLLSKEYLPVLELADTLYTELDYLLQQNPDAPVREEFRKYVPYTREHLEQFHQQLRNYCTKIDSVKDIKIAPFHLLATSKGTHFKETHKAHLEHFKKLSELSHAKLIIPTEYIEVDLTNQESMDEAIEWWENLTASGYEGAIFKTWHFTEPGAIPMLKCRGKEYLRIIYGVNYDMPDQMVKHKMRSTAKKRKLHMAESLLGMISLERFVHQKDTHDYMLALLSLTENDGIDIRL